MNKHAPMSGDYLPMTREEMKPWGWDELDILLISGDAYVDHPSFGAPLLGRWLVAHGFRVGLITQPRWESDADVRRMGRPRLFAGVTAGALDSMVAHYTSFRKKRSDDAYTPGGKAGARPNRATLVYTNLVRQAFPGLPVILGGIEASMRRAVHYDFWKDDIRRSILLDSKADLLIYGMAEKPILEAAERLRQNMDRLKDMNRREIQKQLQGIRGTAFQADPATGLSEKVTPIALPSFEEITADRKKLMPATLALESQAHGESDWVIQSAGAQTTIFAPPAEPLTTAELDQLYALPFTRLAHPSYREPIPALEMIQFSITLHRGCAGGCSFCSLALHQGRRIQSRSTESVLSEIEKLTSHPAWRGSISDMGGPSANMWRAFCRRNHVACKRESCMFPDICADFQTEQTALTELLIAASRVQGVKHVRVASGVRYDLALRDPAYTQTLIRSFVGGQLKLAPEHSSEKVLQLMRKPRMEVFEKFLSSFEKLARSGGKEQYVVPYLISAFPGCTLDDMVLLSCWLEKRHWTPRQVQCFLPTPGTVATAMFCGKIDSKGNPIPVASTDAERLRQHHILIQELKKADPASRRLPERPIERGGNRKKWIPPGKRYRV